MAAEPPAPMLGLPLDCPAGKSCPVRNYVDHDAGPGVADYSCGALSYDGHKGSDFAVHDPALVRRGVAVLAVAAGRVLRLRNSEPDHILGQPLDRRRFAGRECGNGVVIDHGGDWQSQLCHLRRGSITVRPGQSLAAGQQLGLIGLSGKSEFHHVHLVLRHRGEVVDPFVGRRGAGTCGDTGAAGGKSPSRSALWQPALAARLGYVASGLIATGFSPQVPKMAEVVAGGQRHTRLGRQAPNLVFWVLIYGRHPGDHEFLRFLGPDGAVIAQARGGPVTRHKARWFKFIGKRGRRPWAAGTYVGEYRLLRLRGQSLREVLKVDRKLEVR
ncbi:MAG: M23 family metallopeptidase [Alphaproteobacteria bacterium]|nr:M23 family metallopeptidase [Alphaproteobacteria bacterium]